MSSIICAYCKQPIETVQYRTFKRKKYHCECFTALQNQAEDNNTKQVKASASKERKEVERFICELFQITTLPYIIEKQIADFLKQGYTLSGIEKTLRYFYVLGAKPVDNTKPSIGIIPYVYEEAKEFYRKAYDNNGQNQNCNHEESAPIVIKTKPQSRNIPCDIDIENL